MSSTQRRALAIDGVAIGDDTDCYVIAEIGHNHQGRVETCKELFAAAKECGANAVKLQKRDNRSLFTKAYYDRHYDSENAFGATYGEHREFLEFGREEYAELQACARELGITMFSTAFDIPSADFLEDLDMPAYKIASADLTNVPLLRHVARFGKPMIVSTGGGTMDDVRRAYDTIMPINQQLCILQCTAGYPAEFNELNLQVVETFRRAFPAIQVGLSSHDNGIAMALIAYVLGARVVEKHFTLNRAMKGSDHAFSLERPGLSRMVRDLRRARMAMGDGVKRTYDSERDPLKKMGKKLVAARPLCAGEVLAAGDIAVKSPGDGLGPHWFDQIVGQRLKVDLDEDVNIRLEDIEEAPLVRVSAAE